MGFDVNLAALAGLPALLDRRAHELDTAGIYLVLHARVAGGHTSAALHPLHAVQVRVVAAVHRAVGECARALRAQGRAVRAAIARYATADSSSAAALDRAVPLPAHHGTLPDSVDPGAGPSAFPCDFVGELRFPPDYGAEQPVEFSSANPFGAVSIPHQVMRWLSDQHLMFAGLAEAEERGWTTAADLPAGDWPGCYATAYCFERFSAALEAIDASLSLAARVLGTVWTGHAAAACTRSLVANAGAVHRIVLAVSPLAGPYHQAAADARAVAAAVGSLLLSLADVACQPIDLILGAPAVVHEVTGAIGCYHTARRAAEHAVTAAEAGIARLHAGP